MAASFEIVQDHALSRHCKYEKHILQLKQQCKITKFLIVLADFQWHII